jgi:hypothetical protein
MKTNARYEVITRRNAVGAVLADETIRLTSAQGKHYQGYPFTGLCGRAGLNLP